MAKRFHSGFKSDNGTEYDVEIWDADFGGASTSFTLGGTGFELSYDGDPRNPHQPVVGSSCTFRMEYETANQSALETFYGELTSAEEGRFQVKITTGSTPSIFWFGNLLTDVSSLPDISPNALTITAADGLGALSKVDYNNSGTAYSGSATLLDHVVNCLGKIGTLDTFFTTDAAIATVVNWYEDSHATTSADDPFDLTRTSHLNFYSVDEYGEENFEDCLKVLTTCVERFGARIYLSGGKFRIEQISERTGTSFTERTYQKDGTYVTATSVNNYGVTLDQSSEARLADGSFNWLPPVREVVVKYTAKNWFNRLPYAQWSSSSQPTVTTASINHNNGNATLNFGLNVFPTLQNLSYTAGDALFLIFKLELKVGSRYLRRNTTSVNNFAVTYEQAQWSTTQSYYYFHVSIPATLIPAVGSTAPAGVGNVSFITPPLLESGTADVTVTFQGTRKQSNGAGVGALQLVPTWTTQNASLYVSSSGNPVLEFADVTIKASSTATANSERIVIETVLGDGPTVNAVNRLEVYDGADWSDSSLWGVGPSGTLLLSSLHAQQVLAMRQSSLRTYVGRMRGTMLAHSRLDFDSQKWLLLQGRFTANFDEWGGTWVAVTKSTTGITIGSPINTGGGGAPGNPGGGVISNPGQTGIPNPGANTGGLIGGATVNGLLSSGTVTSISTTQTLNGGAFVTGQVLTIVNPATGFQQNVTVTADTQAGDTSISVSGYLADDFPAGSFIVSSPQNQTVQGYGSSTTSATSAAQTSTWWDIFQQWWSEDSTNDIDWPIEAPNVSFEVDNFTFDGDGIRTANNATGREIIVGKNGDLQLNNLAPATTYDVVSLDNDNTPEKLNLSKFAYIEQWWSTDNTNDADWPIEAPNVVFETDEDAGDGATAGLRMDGDGLQTWKNNSATPTTYFLANGIWEYRSDGTTGSSSSGIIVGSASGLRTFKSTSTTPVVNLTNAGAITLRSTPLVGNGSTAGWKITDTSGIELFKSTSATATVQLKPDGTIILNHAGTPTAASGGIFQNSGVLYNANAAGTKWQPQLGHILHVNLFGWGEAWSVGTVKEFFRFTSEYTAYEIHAFGYTFGSTLGSGSGSNTIDVKFFDESAGTSSTLTTLTASSFTTNLVSITAKDIDQGDAIWFDCTAVKSTPAQGCTVDIYFRLA